MRALLDRPTIHLYQPDADAVSLVVEAYGVSQPMKRDWRGNWTVRLCRTFRELHGLEYHFSVRRNNATFTIADPLARHTERRQHQLTSRFSDISYRWQHPRFRAPRMRDIVIYESHLPALSRHQSAPVLHEQHRGTYAGARSPAVLGHLQRLNVAVEFLPLHASDALLGQDWGYFSTSFHAMRECYSHDKGDVNREVMAVVDAMHGRGIPVLLDVVFNHGGELWVKAWGEDIVYRKHDDGDFCHGSGCGPTIRTEHPKVRESIIDTLAHLVDDYHFDGFRFDLGALHDKDTMLAIDRRLPGRVYLVAEPWAPGGAQWGKGDMSGVFASTRWAVWNDDFREAARTFITGAGDYHDRDRLMCGITGSHVRDGGWALRPQQSVNYVSCHDGHTLADLVGGDKRRVFLGALLVLTSQGIPMLGEGTELLHSKQGHDNSYDRRDLNQIDWDNALLHQDLVTAVGKLIALRQRMPHFRYTTHLRKRHIHNRRWDIDWIFPTGYPHEDNQSAIGFVIRPPRSPLVWGRQRRRLIVLLNGSTRGCDFRLPGGSWKLIVDGERIKVDERGIRGVPHARDDYHVQPGVGVVLARA
jgi:pullulanase